MRSIKNLLRFKLITLSVLVLLALISFHNKTIAQDFNLGIYGYDAPGPVRFFDAHEQLLISNIRANFITGMVESSQDSILAFYGQQAEVRKVGLEHDPTFNPGAGGPYYVVSGSDFSYPYNTILWAYISRNDSTEDLDSTLIGQFIRNVDLTYDTPAFNQALGEIQVAHQGWMDSTSHWPYIRCACDSIQYHFGDRVNSSVCHNVFLWRPGSTLEDFFSYMGNSLDVYQHEFYPFHDFTQWPNPTDSTDFIGNDFQTRIIDNRLITSLEWTKQALENSGNNHTQLEIIIQTHRHYEYGELFRRPTEAEIWLQAFLALSRGIKGVHSYVYFSYAPYLSWGLVDEQPAGTNRNPIDPYYSSISNLYSHLDSMASELLPLEVDTAFTYTGGTIRYIQNVTGDTSDGDHRTIEVAVFDPYNGNDYFMLINRRCSRDNYGTPAFPQTITVRTNKTGQYQIRDLYSDELFVSSDGYFRNITIGPGRGRVFELRQMFVSNETWAGTVNICSNITVPQGRTLTISPSSNLNFRIGTGLDVYGKLIANGTSSQPITMDRIGTSGRWSKIRFYDSADDASTLKYCNISNANYGTYCDRAHPTIENCTFSNCYYGIVGYYAAPEIGYNTITNSYLHGIYLKNANGYSFEIHNNTVTQTTTNDGVRLYKSSPDLYQNTIFNNSGTGADGVYCETQSSCKFYHQDEGFNNIHTNGLNEVHAYNNSDLILGTSILYNVLGIWNRVVDPGSGIRIKANSYCDVTAEYNWWGGYPPQSSWFSATNGSTIDYTPALSSDPLGSGSMLLAGSPIQQEVNESSNLEEMLQRASLCRWYEKYETAFVLCDSIIQAAPETETAKHALSIWWDAFTRAKKGDFLPIAEKIINAYPDLEISGLASSIIADIHGSQKEFEKASKQLDRISNLFPKSMLHKYALFDKVNVAINDFQDIEKAKTLLSELEENFPGDELIEDLKIMLAIEGQSYGLNKPANGQFAENQPKSSPTSFRLEPNFPNPFNPETEIRYQLPEASHVNLTIYNLLGQKIRTLVDKSHLAGFYSVRWDGKDDKGVSVSSGVYLYVIAANRFHEVRKMLLLR